MILGKTSSRAAKMPERKVTRFYLKKGVSTKKVYVCKKESAGKCFPVVAYFHKFQEKYHILFSCGFDTHITC